MALSPRGALASPTQCFQVTIGTETFDIKWTGCGWTINGTPVTVSLTKISDGCYSLILDGKSTAITLYTTPEGSMRVTTQGQTIDVTVKDDIDLLQERFTQQESRHSATCAIRAPMPGLVLDVRVRAGETVNTGDGLLVLEAMKMENELNAPQDGVIQTVHVTTGDAVARNSLLIELKPLTQ